MRLSLLAGLLAAATSARAGDKAPASNPFDGDILRKGKVSGPARDWGPLARFTAADGRSLNFCASEILANPGLPREQFAVDARITCDSASGPGPLAAFTTLAAPGRDGGSFAGAGLRALLGARSLEDADFRRRLGGYYAAVAAAPASGPGWAWTLALKAADGNPFTAMRLAGYCGHDDVSQLPALAPVDAAEAKSAYDEATALLKARAVPAAAPADPLSSSADSLAANDRLADQDRLAALAPADFNERRAPLCPPAGSAFYLSDALGAGAASARRRIFSGALLACETVRAGATRAQAETATANGAWVDRLIRLSHEAEHPAGAGPLGALEPSRADAFRLLADWRPESPFPGKTGASRPKGWSEGRFRAALDVLDALGEEWRRGVADYATGARFGAKACAPR